MRVEVLGSCRVKRGAGDEPVDVGARKPRSILAALAMHAGRPVSAGLLADLVWAGSPPAAAHGALHSYLSGLRRALEPDRAARGPGSVIVTTDHGYVLGVDALDVDTHAFSAEVRAAERELGPLASILSPPGPGAARPPWPSREAVTGALDALDLTLSRWRGEPYADLPDHPDVLAERAALEQLRGSAEELRLLALLALGEHAGVLSATEPATARHQLRERLWALHAVALARAGRQADALDALRAVRSLLVEQLGLDPGAELRLVEESVLRQDAALHRVLAHDDVPTAPTSPTAPAGPAAPGRARPLAPRGSARTVGREAELRALREELARARSGLFGCAHLVGEPGIGKTRLVEDVAESAAQAGLTVTVGRCSPDDGAPALWPWRTVLADVGVDVEAVLAPGERDSQWGSDRRAFVTADLVSTAVVTAARERPVLLVLEDLHWADDASLRVLQHLLDTVPDDAPVCVLLTRRAHPAAIGRLALVVESLARRHATTLELAGLDEAGSASLLRDVGGESEASLAEWSARARGNPYFLIELARLGDRGPSSRLPTTVRDVVVRRLDGLSPAARAALFTASVVGQSVRLAVVAAVAGRDLDAVAQDLDEAVRAGLMDETGPESYVFAHALTREAVYQSVSRTGRARAHSRAAPALSTDPLARRQLAAPERTAEVARHWLAAGPSHADEAWPAARAAAAQARGLAAYAEAAELAAAAISAHRQASEGGLEERYDLLLELAGDSAYAARWPVVETAVAEAVAIGRQLGDPDRVGEAASAMTRYCVWIPHDVDVVLQDVVDDLRWALAQAPADEATRCRLQLSLAVELYYDPSAGAERLALVAAGSALGRRAADPALAWWASRAAWMASWVPRLVPERLALSQWGVEAARAGGDPAAEAVSLATQAVDLLELGDSERYAAVRDEGDRLARRERLPYALLTLGWLDFTLAAMRDERDLVDTRVAEVTGISRQIAVPAQDIQAAAAATLAHLWDPEALRGVLDQMVAASSEHDDGATAVHSMLARCGYVDQLRLELERTAMPAPTDENWATLYDWCCEAEAAAVAGAPGLAARAVTVLGPYSGRMAVAGAAVVMGPVDGYLALALATVQELETATDHADRAEAMARLWGLSAYQSWLAGHRARLGF